jgi:integrase
MKPEFLTPPQLLALLKAAREHSIRSWAMILLAYRHAMRASEVCNLRVSDVDLKSGTVRVARLKGSLLSVQPIEKLKGQPLLDERKALTLWLAERDDNSPFLFTSQKGGRIDRTQFFRILKQCAERAGVPQISPHTLKHTRVSLVLEGGATLAEAQRLAGHASLKSTLWYTHTTDAAAAKAGREAESALF